MLQSSATSEDTAITMSKAHSIIKLLTFGALGTAAYLQAGSDPQSMGRLTIIFTNLLGTLSGEVAGGILDRTLFGKEAESQASAIGDVIGEAFGKALKEALQKRNDPGSEKMETIIRRYGEKWRGLIALAEPEIAKTTGTQMLAQLQQGRLLEAWELEGLIAEIASDGGDEPYLTDDAIRSISEEVYDRLPAAFLDELTNEHSGKPFRKTLIEAIGKLLNNADEVLSTINRLDEKASRIERKIEAAAVPSFTALHQIPPPQLDFTGREAEIVELMATLEDASLAIYSLQGMGGVGKTALALKLAEKIKERYPEGQFYLDLRGVSPQPLAPAEAMAHVIHAYHPGARLPESEAELRGAYLSVLHNQRALLLMDNAKDESQIEQLIPPLGCRMLVTSRQYFTLPGLFAITLHSLLPADACKLLLTIAPRIGELAEEIAKLCGYLPLALRLAGNAIANRPNLKPADYVRKLTSARERLRLIEASLSLSYEILSDELQHRWRALAVFPESFDEVAAAEVWEIEDEKAQEALGEMLAFSLVEWNEAAGRYRLHDLARVFADSRLSDPERDNGRRLHARHYQTVLSAANNLYLKGGDGVIRGLAHFDQERTNIEVGQAWTVEQADHDEEAAELCCTYPEAGVYVLDLRQHPRQRKSWLEVALATSRRLNKKQLPAILGLNGSKGVTAATMALSPLFSSKPRIADISK